MPGRMPRTTAQVIAASALREVMSGTNEDDAIERLIRRFGWLSESAAGSAYAAAVSSTERGAAMTERIENLVDDPENTPANIHEADGEALIIVEIIEPGSDTRYRQIRLPIRDGMSEQDIIDAVDEITDNWLRRSGNNQQSFAWRVAAVA